VVLGQPVEERRGQQEELVTLCGCASPRATIRTRFDLGVGRNWNRSRLTP
jgi:hypothetical protein